MREKLFAKIKELSNKYSVLAGEVRLLIISVLLARSQATWSELRSALEDLLGKPVNPNVLAFHLRKLVEAGIVEKVQREEGEYAYQLRVEMIEAPELRELAELAKNILQRR